MGLLSNAAHDQDVVVGTERHEEHEHQERQHEVETCLSSEVHEDDPGQAQGAQIGHDDARDQVQRRDRAPHDHRQQDGDQDRHDGDDPLQVRSRDGPDVVGELEVAEQPGRGRTSRCADGVDCVAQAWDGVERCGARRIAAAYLGRILDRETVGADQLSFGPVGVVLLLGHGRRRRHGRKAEGRAESRVELSQLVGRERDAVRIERPDDALELGQRAEPGLGRRKLGGVLPHRPGELEQDQRPHDLR